MQSARISVNQIMAEVRKAKREALAKLIEEVQPELVVASGDFTQRARRAGPVRLGHRYRRQARVRRHRAQP
jgi:hypothetical protein